MKQLFKNTIGALAMIFGFITLIIAVLASIPLILAFALALFIIFGVPSFFFFIAAVAME